MKPLFGSDTRSRIIETLRHNPSLTARKIYNLLKKNNISKTYQAVHKILQKMIEDKILVKKELSYEINPDWVEEIESYVSEIKKTEIPKARSVMTKLDKGQTVHFSVNKEIHMGGFILDFLSVALKKEAATPIVAHFKFAWSLFPISEKQREILKKVISTLKMFILVHDNFFYDRWTMKQWEAVNAKMKLNQKSVAKQNDVIVIGDYIMNIFWDEKHLEWVLGDSKKVKSEKDIDMNLLLKMIVESETKIDFIIRKDPVAARNIREKTIKVFE